MRRIRFVGKVSLFTVFQEDGRFFSLRMQYKTRWFMEVFLGFCYVLIHNTDQTYVYSVATPFYIIDDVCLQLGKKQ